MLEAKIFVVEELLGSFQRKQPLHPLLEKLLQIGVETRSVETFFPDKERVRSAIEKAFKEVPLVFLIGPVTAEPNDLLRQQMAFHFDREFEVRRDFAETVLDKDLENPHRYAIFPKEAQVFFDGASPIAGFALKEEQKVAVLIPSENFSIESALPEILSFLDHHFAATSRTRSFRALKKKEACEELIQEFHRHFPEVMVTPLSSQVHTDLLVTKRRVVTNQPDLQKAEEYLFQKGFLLVEDLLSNEVAKRLLQKKKTLSLAESCTGGNVSSLLTRVPGISSSFLGSIVCYSNEAKEALLGVPRPVLEEEGAVSKSTAEALLEGLSKRFDSDLCGAITGIAGPSGGSKTKPVGLVYVAAARRGEAPLIEELHLSGSRDEIIEAATDRLLSLLLESMKIS